MATGVVDGWYQKEVSGQLTREQAQKGARDELSRLRFGQNAYFFIQGYDGTTLLHIDRSLEGKNRINTMDPDGVPTVRRQIAIAQSGGGFLAYRTPRTKGTSASSDDAVPKLSYVAPFAPWNWAVATGIYIDDVTTIFNRVVFTFALVAGTVLVIGGGVCYHVGRSISRPLSVITERMGALGRRGAECPCPLPG